MAVSVNSEDKAKSYYKYFEMGIQPNTEEDYALAGKGRGRSEDALPFSRRNDLLSQTRLPSETGYYLLPEGGYHVAVNIPVPNITGEMMFWWTAWHGLDSLRYKCWNPDDHFDVALGEGDAERILDPNIPLHEKTWGTKQIVTEKLGDAPLETIAMTICDPAQVGYDLSKLGTPGCQYISVARSVKNGIVPVFVTATLAQNEDNINEFRERWWIGWDYIEDEDDGPMEFGLLQPGLELPEIEAACRDLITHALKEYRNLNKILPELYKEEKNNW